MSASTKSAIKIYCRLKPITGLIGEYEVQTVNHETGEEVIKIRDETVSSSLQAVNNKVELHSFRFSRVFERKCKQDYIFDQVARPVVDGCLGGYNGTIFAYGQTGSGKTYTMTGNRSVYDQRGIIPRTLEYIFERCQQEQEQDPSKTHNIFVSYLEIYNEGGFDLLNSACMSGRLEDLSKVTLMEDGNQKMHLRNLTVHSIDSVVEATDLLYLGDHNRTVAETPLNEVSTRSHCIFTIHLSIRDSNTSLTRRSKLHLVDLAGSERVSNSSITGQLLTEARHINLALHYLEQVIVALSDTNRSHIPYRNSMMTSVLRDSLGGNCRTSMIATLSLEHKNIQETLSTCRFAQRVALVTNAAVLNEELDPTHVIMQLKHEVRKLKEIIATSSVMPMKENARPLSDEEQADCCALVSQFMSDPDQFAILPVLPDMRMIQECFRVLKSNLKCPRVQSKALRLYSGAAILGTADENGMAQTIARRDAEIKVLMDMLRKERQKRSQSQTTSRESLNTLKLEHFGLQDSGQGGQGEQLGGPGMKGMLDIESLNSFIPGDIPGTRATDPHAVTPPPSRAEFGLSAANGLTEAKRVALADFMEKYSGTGTLESIRSNMLKKRSEIRSLESMLGSNKTNMQSLQTLVANPGNGSDVQVTSITDALSSQQRTYDMQEERLKGVREEVNELESVLKAQYRKLMVEFEDWWNNRNGEDRLRGERKGAKDDFKLGVTSILRRSEVETKSKEPENGGSRSRPKALARRTVPARPEGADPPVLTSSIGPADQSHKFKDINGNDYAFKTPEELRKSLPRAPPVTPVTPSTSPPLAEEGLHVMRTGDSETDEEIFNFLKARKEMYKKIQEGQQQQQETPQ